MCPFASYMIHEHMCNLSKDVCEINSCEDDRVLILFHHQCHLFHSSRLQHSLRATYKYGLPSFSLFIEHIITYISVTCEQSVARNGLKYINTVPCALVIPVEPVYFCQWFHLSIHSIVLCACRIVTLGDVQYFFSLYFFLGSCTN